MQWHDLLGAVLIDFFQGSAFSVDTEVDLSLKKQFLDILVIRRQTGEFDRPLPDGFGPLADHNLISFKSHQDAFDMWALLELVSYYVCYRKQVNSDPSMLLPASQIRLLGIAARFPEKLAKEIALVRRQPGVYDIEWGSLTVRLLVIRELPEENANAMLMLFSVVPKQIEFACQQYQKTNPQSSGTIDELIRLYRREDEKMAVTFEDINRKVQQELLSRMSLEERLAGVSAEDRVRGLPRRELAKAFLREELQRDPTSEEIDAFLVKARQK